jgi:hypothetical protein
MGVESFEKTFTKIDIYSLTAKLHSIISKNDISEYNVTFDYNIRRLDANLSELFSKVFSKNLTPDQFKKTYITYANLIYSPDLPEYIRNLLDLRFINLFSDTVYHVNSIKFITNLIDSYKNEYETSDIIKLGLPYCNSVEMTKLITYCFTKEGTSEFNSTLNNIYVDYVKSTQAIRSFIFIFIGLLLKISIVNNLIT